MVSPFNREIRETLKTVADCIQGVAQSVKDECDKGLAEAELCNEFLIYTETGELCQRLTGRMQTFGDMAFLPVESFVSGKRFYPRSDLLMRVTEMEAVALAAKCPSTGE